MRDINPGITPCSGNADIAFDLCADAALFGQRVNNSTGSFFLVCGRLLGHVA